jgi:FlaA1/EpsC-like NDP-sugar epimerase
MASFTDDNITSSEICNYYKNKSVFITGATGFLGKVLIEKLLRTCNQLNKIYLLIRPKKGKQPNERIDEIFNCKVGIFLNLFCLLNWRCYDCEIK